MFVFASQHRSMRFHTAEDIIAAGKAHAIHFIERQRFLLHTVYSAIFKLITGMHTATLMHIYIFCLIEFNHISIISHQLNSIIIYIFILYFMLVSEVLFIKLY